MTLSKARPEASHGKPVDDSAAEVLLYGHTVLDAHCRGIWSRLWRNDGDTTWTEKEHSQIMEKMVRSYSNVHQLHRLISKHIEALSTSGDLPAHVLAPLTFLDHLSSVFLETTEQQMALIVGTLVVQMKEYVAVIPSTGISHGMAAVAQVGHPRCIRYILFA